MLAVVFTVYPEPDTRVEFAIWQLLIIIVDAGGHVNSEPDDVYDPEPMLLDNDAVRFNPVILYVFAIVSYFRESGVGLAIYSVCVKSNNHIYSVSLNVSLSWSLPKKNQTLFISCTQLISWYALMYLPCT